MIAWTKDTNGVVSRDREKAAVLEAGSSSRLQSCSGRSLAAGDVDLISGEAVAIRKTEDGKFAEVDIVIAASTSALHDGVAEASLLNRQHSSTRLVRFHIITHQESIDHPDMAAIDGRSAHNGVSGRLPSSSRIKISASADTIPSSFLRVDSIIFRVRPGQSFTEYANVVVEPPSASDPKLGTLGELRHHLRTGTKSQVKKFLRSNPWPCGHRIRAELWKELCRDSNTDAQRLVYKDFLVSLGNLQMNPAFLSAPGVVICDHQLKESGRACLLRLLTAIEHERPDFTYIPVLYPLCALFLHYMSEEDAFACVMNLLAHSQKFLIQTDIASAASKRTLVVLLKKHANRAYIFIQKLSGAHDDKDLVLTFDDWKSWIFRDLPFSHMVRVVDCFLYEGQKVLFRVALALILLWYKARHKELRHKTGWTCRQIGNDVGEFCRAIKISPQRMLKVAFGIRNLKWSTIARLQQRHELNLRHNNSGMAEIASTQNLKQLTASHHYIDVRLNSNILTQNQAMQLCMWLPSRYQLFTPSKIFSTEEDGRSFTRLWTKIDDYCPTIIVIRTSLGEIFGAYCSMPWSTRKRRSSTSYFGTGETFLFRFTPEGEQYGWVGAKKGRVSHSEELFQAADATTLIVGGGTEEGLSIRRSLETGSSQRCDTFNNVPLSAQRDFQVQALEVFGFTAEE